MDAGGQLVLTLLIYVAFGAVTATVAHHKGRNTIGWFFIGFLFTCIGLVIILCLSNLNEERAKWEWAENEQRRLREQLKQERLKNAVFQGHVRARLDVHDTALDMDTRQLTAQEQGAAAEALSPPQASEFPDPATFSRVEWFAQLDDRASDQLTFAQLKGLYRSGNIKESNLVWTSGMKDWKPISDVPGLLEELV